MALLKINKIFTQGLFRRQLNLRTQVNTRGISYTQGQVPEGSKTREYFYYIDHQGQLFLDDVRIRNFITCFKDKKFLQFFFKRLRPNNTGCYTAEFPYLSPCAGERNFIRCDDRPIVFTHIITKPLTENNPPTSDTQVDLLSYGGAGDLLTVPFRPSAICMLPKSGRIYHPSTTKSGGVGLIKSSLAIDLSQHFEFPLQKGESTPPSHFNWNNKRYELTNEIVELLNDDDYETSTDQ